MIRFIHTGDLHLGLQFKKAGFNRKVADLRRIEIWDTFERIVDKAIKEEVDFLFIAGDLFEEKYFTLGDIKRVRDNLENAKGVNIIITAGNHDTLNTNSLYNRIEWPENITIFGTQGLGCKEFTDLNTYIYGYSWDAAENNKDIFCDFKELDKDKNNILIIHGDIFSKDSKYLPLYKEQLNSLDFDYIGLGHIHKPEIISDGIAYCGSPEPLDFGETGQHGIIEGRIRDKNIEIKFLPFSKRTFLERTVNIDETMGYIDIIEKIKETDDKYQLKKNLYRIKLEGIIDKDIKLNSKDLLQSLKDEFYYLEIIDNTIVDYDLDKLEGENKDNIIGYFIKEMRDKDLGDKIVRDALYIGLEALMKGKVGI